MKHGIARIIPLIVQAGICDRRTFSLFQVGLLTEQHEIDPVFVEQLITHCINCQPILANHPRLPESDFVESADAFIGWACATISKRPQALTLNC